MANTKEHMQEIIKLLTPYLMAFPSSKANEGTLIVYAKALAALNLAEIETAMLKLLRTTKFFPSVAEIYEAAENIKAFANRKEIAQPADAWEEVMRQVHDVFVYKEPVFSSPAIKRAAMSMGWTSLCELPVEGMNTARAQFMRIYENEINRAKNRKTNAEIINMIAAKKVELLIKGAAGKLSVVNGGREMRK